MPERGYFNYVWNIFLVKEISFILSVLWWYLWIRWHVLPNLKFTSVCLFTERTVSEVTSNRDEVEEANQTLHGNFKLGLPHFFLILILKVFFYKSLSFYSYLIITNISEFVAQLRKENIELRTKLDKTEETLEV